MDKLPPKFETNQKNVEKSRKRKIEDTQESTDKEKIKK